MTYALSLYLQKAVFAALDADSSLTGRVHDALPAGPLPQTWLQLGEEDARDRSDLTAAGAEARFTVSILTSQPGFSEAKSLAARVCDLLDGADLSLERGTLTRLGFDRARARRTGRNGDMRRIDLRFAARLDDT